MQDLNIRAWSYFYIFTAHTHSPDERYDQACANQYWFYTYVSVEKVSVYNAINDFCIHFCCLVVEPWFCALE